MNKQMTEKLLKVLLFDDSQVNNELPFKIGQSYYFRSVTYHVVGKVTEIIGKYLLLEDASWVADSGRFMGAIKEGTLDEVEPCGDMILNSDSLVDIYPWTHKLPTKQK